MSKTIKVNNETKAKQIVSDFESFFDAKSVNNMLSATGNSDIGVIKKQTLTNIANWCLNGASKKDLLNNLELSDKQFKVLCSVCPIIPIIMEKSYQMADAVIGASLLQTAIGGQVIHEQQAVKIKDYNEDGTMIGEHIEMVEVCKELPPNPLLLKFIAENKFSEKFGKEKIDSDKEIISIVENADAEQLARLEKELNKDFNDEQ